MTAKQARCYSNRYPDLKKAFGYNVKALQKHWVSFGRKEKRNKSCGPSKAKSAVIAKAKRLHKLKLQKISNAKAAALAKKIAEQKKRAAIAKARQINKVRLLKINKANVQRKQKALKIRGGKARVAALAKARRIKAAAIAKARHLNKVRLLKIT